MNIKQTLQSRKATHYYILTATILAILYVFQRFGLFGIEQNSNSYMGLLIALPSFAFLFVVGQMSRKYVLKEPKPGMASFQEGEEAFVIMAPKDKRNELFAAFLCCGIYAPMILLSVYISGSNFSGFNSATSFLFLVTPIIFLYFFLYFSQVIPAIFNSAEFSNDKLILTGVSRGKITIPMQNLVKIERKKDWISRLRFCSEGEIISVYAKGEDGSEEKHVIRLLKGMKNRELFLSLLKQRCAAAVN